MINLIAEIGGNHDGNISLAKDMIDAAAQNGANYVKFQSWREKDLRHGPRDEDDAPFLHYKNKRDFYKTSELLDEQHYELIDHCKKQNIKFLTTCFNRGRVDFLSKLGLDSIKVASCDANSKSMIRELSNIFDRVIVSTGMTTNEEIKSLAGQLHELEVDFVLMHCVSIYPTPIDKISLPRMDFIKKLAEERFEMCANMPTRTLSRGEFGISDHSLGINVAMIAATMGATWIEKHFTIENNLPGPDNKISITPGELKAIRDFCDVFETMSNSKETDVQEQEMELRKILTKRFGDNS
tara:strand:+ start:3291 stop:4178 length:888 start_codon:yes stop_codon:yes gene_type:complete